MKQYVGEELKKIIMIFTVVLVLIFVLAVVGIFAYQKYTIQGRLCKTCYRVVPDKSPNLSLFAILKLSGNYLLSNESAIILIATPVTIPAIKPVMSLFGFVDS